MNKELRLKDFITLIKISDPDSAIQEIKSLLAGLPVTQVIEGELLIKLEVTTELIQIDESDFIGGYDVTKCCKVGPVVNENYCPECGKKIIRQ